MLTCSVDVSLGVAVIKVKHTAIGVVFFTYFTIVRLANATAFMFQDLIH